MSRVYWLLNWTAIYWCDVFFFLFFSFQWRSTSAWRRGDIFALKCCITWATYIYSLPVQTWERFFFLSEQQLKCLLDEHFTVKEIAAMSSVSQRTIRNRMTQCQLSVRQTYSDISDEDLKIHVMEFIASCPNTGQKMVMGHLKARGIRYVSNYEYVSSSENCLKWYTTHLTM